MDNLLEHLPPNEIACVHDYSESYCCRQKDEIQSKYFDIAQVSLHISVVYHHAVDSVDGNESTEEPVIIKEHIFVISDDVTQDYDSVHRAQELFDKYLKDEIKIPVVKVHEFTDGCAAQYKSRHCVGDLSCCFADFGCKINRNYFETSHAQKEQDASGSNVKQKVSQVVLRKTASICNRKDMQDFLSSSFMSPTATTFSSRTKPVGLQRHKFFMFLPLEMKRLATDPVA